MLLARNSVTPEELARALAAQAVTGRRLGTELVEQGVINEREMTTALGEQLGLEVADLRREVPNAEAARLITETIARDIAAVPLRVEGNQVYIVAADPLDPRLPGALASLSGRVVHLLLAPPSEVRGAINQAYRAIDDVDVHVREFEASDVQRARAGSATAAESIETAPIIEVVNLIMTQALRDRASDVHIEPQDDRLRIRFRIDGALHEVLSLPSTMAPALVSRIKILADMNIVERRRPQDGQFRMTIDRRDLDVRVATTTTIWGEKAVLRLLDKSRSLFKLGDLGMPRATHALYSRLVRSPFGMVICTGPTGSGKTTTLYATLSEINRSELNVMTIEDPVEYIFPEINQIQINDQADITFASGLKSILRQDPDVILVGEVRDVETARIAVQSALTGHFVLSSMHATDASSALYRLLDMGVESFLIASSVIAVVGQRLVRRICSHCRVIYTPQPEELLFYRDAGGPPKEVFWRGEGCNICAGTGYYERIGVYEVLEVSNEIRKLLVTGASPDTLRDLAVSQGLRPLRQEATRLVTGDITTISEIIRSIYVM